MFKGFRQFILRGNVVDLAVAVVIGAAFNGVVQSFVKDIITPLIGAIYSPDTQKQFADAYFTINNSRFMFGDFLNTAISFIVVAAVVYFFVVNPVNKLIALSKRSKTTPESSTKKCPYCYSDIPKKATRCAFCTSRLEADKKTQ